MTHQLPPLLNKLCYNILISKWSAEITDKVVKKLKVNEIEKILIENGVSQSQELSLALVEILKSYSRDTDLAKQVAKNIDKEKRTKDILKRGKI